MGAARTDSPSSVLFALVVLSLAPGCPDPDLAQLAPKVSFGIDENVQGGGVARVDLLFVIDDSQSMHAEQAKLAREIPRLVESLTAPPDEDGDGEPDWNAVESLSVAVITTDLGTNGVTPPFPLGTCEGAGDDGRLRDEITSTADCAPGPVDPILTWEAGEDALAFADQVGCVAQAGTLGCGFEQQLAAAARALSLGDGAFPRDDALLAVVVLSDEEDCSLADAPSFYGALGRTTNLNQYCTMRPDLLTPVAELLERMRGVRDPEQFFFAAITGVPIDASGAAPEAILLDPRMEHVFTATPLGLAPACTAPPETAGSTVQEATPARRIVELAGLLPDSYVHSICADDFRPAVSELARRIGRRITDVCITRTLAPRPDGSVDCVVRERLPLGVTCEGLPGRTHAAPEADGRVLCEIEQAPRGVGTGWFYDGEDPSCPAISFTPDAQPVAGAGVELQCLLEVGDPMGSVASP